MHVFPWDLFRVCVACLICFDLAGRREGKGRGEVGGIEEELNRTKLKLIL